MSTLYRRSPNASLYPQAYRSNFFGPIVYDPSFALANDRDLPAKLMRDPIVAQAYDHRTRSVAQKTWRLKPASERPEDVQLAMVLEWLIRRCPRLSRSLRQLAGAFLWGSTWAQIRCEERSEVAPDDQVERNWLVLADLVDVDRRMFHQVVRRNGPDGSMRLVWEMATTDPRHGTRWVEGDGKEGRWDPSHYVHHVHESRHATLQYGGGLIEALYWYHYAKGVALKEGLQGLVRWAQGWVVFKGDRTGDSDADNPNSTFISNAIQELETHSGRKVLGIDRQDAIEVADGPSTGWEMVKWWIEYLDAAMTRCLTGALLPLGGGADVGSNARGKVEQDTQDLVSQGDQEDLGGTLTQGLVVPMRVWNAGPLDALGLDRAAEPTWEFVQDVVEDPEVNARVIQVAAGVGLPLDAEDAYDKLNLKRPKDEASTLRLAPPVVPGMTGGAL